MIVRRTSYGGAYHLLPLHRDDSMVLLAGRKDLGQRVHANHEVDGVGAQEREIGEVALVPVDPHLGRMVTFAGDREALVGPVDADHHRSLLGQRDRDRTGSAPELEHALALEVAEEPQLPFGGPTGAVGDGVAGL